MTAPAAPLPPAGRDGTADGCHPDWLRDVLEALPDAAKAVDLEGRVSACNDALATLWRLPPELRASDDWLAWERHIASQLAQPDDYIARNRAVVAGDGRRSLDIVHHVDGRVFERMGLPWRRSGRLCGMLFHWRDVTAEHEHLRVRALQQASDAANRQRAAFIARLSHELRTPLTAVVGLTDLMAHDPRPPEHPDHQRRLDRVRRAGEHMVQLLDDLLDLSHIEAGEMPVRLERVDALALAHEVTAELELAAQARAVRFDVQCAAPLVLLADRLRLRQVLTNLVSNAVKYGREGGVVRLRLFTAGDSGLIEVEDDGQGLDETQLARLFEPFNRLGRDRGPIQGTGLGLVISRALVTRMQGLLTAGARREGEGCCFAVRLPRWRPGAGPAGG